jgi:hypothetical protein
MGENSPSFKEFKKNGSSVSIPEMVLGLQNWEVLNWKNEQNRIKQTQQCVLFQELEDKIKKFCPTAELSANGFTILGAEARKNVEDLLSRKLEKSVGKELVRADTKMSLFAYFHSFFPVETRELKIRKYLSFWLTLYRKNGVFSYVITHTVQSIKELYKIGFLEGWDGHHISGDWFQIYDLENTGMTMTYYVRTGDFIISSNVTKIDLGTGANSIENQINLKD